MTRLHVVMKQRQSPIASFPSVPHEIYERKKEACDRTAELNRKSTFNYYWVESATLKQAGSSYWEP
jgi:hypothetical protein